MNHTNLEIGIGEKAPLDEHKHAREALLRSLANLRDFVENAPEGLRRVGPDGLILWANKSELDMLGYTREEYIGHHIAEFFADAPVIEDFLACLARGETLREREAQMVCKDGSIRHVLINSNALFEGGKFIHTRCITRDITDRKLDEEKMIAAYEQESAARAVAEAASRSKDEFIAVVLQSLRSPLNVILGCDRLLREDQIDAAQLRQSWDVIVRNAKAQLQLIDDLLTPSRAGNLAAVQRLMSGSSAGAAYETSGQVALQGRGGE
jgi:PAS domain S-box-containing protein